jgi:hypothetical protein
VFPADAVAELLPLAAVSDCSVTLSVVALAAAVDSIVTSVPAISTPSDQWVVL